ncbi:MAG: hypothetical protein U1E62_00785 [Alsobacter sp.]
MSGNARRVAGLAAGLLAGFAAPPAQAGMEWRYCLAIAEQSRAVYLSEPFQSDASLPVLERAYENFLSRNGYAHEPAICPRGDTRDDLLKAREEAISFNKLRGLSASLASWRYGE